MFLQRRLCHSSRAAQSIFASSIPKKSSYFRAALSTSSTTTTCCNTLIIGGGPMGSSTAYHLAQHCRNGDGRGIVVVEKDPTYATSHCSAMLSAGGIRQQYSLLQNVQMSLYGVDFLRNAKDLLRVRVDDDDNDDDNEVDVQFQEHGYLFLASTNLGKEQMLANHMVQRSAGCTNHVLLDQHQLESTFPWINASDIQLASHGTRGEGWFDPWAFIQGLKRKNIEMGVQYIHGIPKSAKRDDANGKVVSIDVELLGAKNKNHSSSSSSTNSGNGVGDNVSMLTTFHVEYVVNAAGARSEDVMTMLAGGNERHPLQFPLPVKPRKRSIFFFHCSAKHGVPPVAPLTVDPSGVYFRSEGSGGSSNTFLCGVSPTKESDPDIYDNCALDSADHDLFENIIWPALYHRVPAFGEIKVKSSWAGLYEYNVIDQNAIIDFHPEMSNVLMLNGFSGHGLQMSPAAGRAGAELIEHGRFQTLDVGIFSFDRCMGLAPPVLELGIV